MKNEPTPQHQRRLANPEQLAYHREYNRAYQARKRGHDVPLPTRPRKPYQKRTPTRSVLEQCARQRLNGARQRARRKGLEFTLTNEWLSEQLQDDTCRLTGVQFYDGEEPRHPHSCSFDRIDVSRGYTPDNVRLVTYIANMLRSDFSDDHIQAFCEGWLMRY